jgi:hypothetical protein
MRVSDSGLSSCSATRPIVDDDSQCVTSYTPITVVSSPSAAYAQAQHDVAYISWMGFVTLLFFTGIGIALHYLGGRNL